MSVLPNGDARLDYAQIYGFRHTQKWPIIIDDTRITSLPLVFFFFVGKADYLMIEIELTNTSLFLFTKFNHKWFSPNNHKDTLVLLELILPIISTHTKFASRQRQTDGWWNMWPTDTDQKLNPSQSTDFQMIHRFWVMLFNFPRNSTEKRTNFHSIYNSLNL